MPFFTGAVPPPKPSVLEMNLGGKIVAMVSSAKQLEPAGLAAVTLLALAAFLVARVLAPQLLELVEYMRAYRIWLRLPAPKSGWWEPFGGNGIELARGIHGYVVCVMAYVLPPSREPTSRSPSFPLARDISIAPEPVLLEYLLIAPSCTCPCSTYISHQAHSPPDLSCRLPPPPPPPRCPARVVTLHRPPSSPWSSSISLTQSWPRHRPLGRYHAFRGGDARPPVSVPRYAPHVRGHFQLGGPEAHLPDQV